MQPNLWLGGELQSLARPPNLRFEISIPPVAWYNESQIMHVMIVYMVVDAQIDCLHGYDCLQQSQSELTITFFADLGGFYGCLNFQHY